MKYGELRGDISSWPKLGGFSVKEVPLQGTASNLYTSKEYPFKRGSFNA